MSRGHGEVQRFVLRYLRQAAGWHDLAGITDRWVHHWLAEHDGHDCAQHGPPGGDPARHLADLAACGDDEHARIFYCHLDILIRRTDTESVRRALRSLATGGLAELDHDNDRRGQLMARALPG